MLAYLMLFAALTNAVCLNNASSFFLERWQRFKINDCHKFVIKRQCTKICHRMILWSKIHFETK